MLDAVRIDGAYGEGGGQIVRTSMSLAVLTGRPVAVENRRAGRDRPGLRPQHLTAVRAAASLCAARLQGDAVGSTTLHFEPTAASAPGHYHFDVGTGGAAPLVAQTVLLPLAHATGPAAHGPDPAVSPAGSTVTIIGGTHVPLAPPADYLEAVYLPALRRAGLAEELSTPAAGFYPRGGGQLELAITPAPLGPIDLTERGRLVSLRAFVVTANLPAHVGDRGAAAVEKFMKGIGRPVAVERRDLPSPGPGAAVLLAVACEGGHAGFSAIGKRVEHSGVSCCSSKQ